MSEQRTLADLALIVMVTLLEVVHDIDESRFEHLTNWKEGLKQELPYFDEIIGNGLTMTLEFTKQ